MGARTLSVSLVQPEARPDEDGYLRKSGRVARSASGWSGECAKGRPHPASKPLRDSSTNQAIDPLHRYLVVMPAIALAAAVTLVLAIALFAVALAVLIIAVRALVALIGLFAIVFVVILVLVVVTIVLIRAR